MTYERTLEAYRSLLKANPGYGLLIPGDCVAFLLDSDQLYACQVQDGRPLLAWMFPITAEAWDDDDEAWLCDAGGLETADAINDPQFVPCWYGTARHWKAKPWRQSPVGTSDQGVAISIERNNEGRFTSSEKPPPRASNGTGSMPVPQMPAAARMRGASSSK
jgi:hypothetical protein